MKRINNPLTIIAIFAGLAEIACSVALVALDKEIQIIFVWFVMGFPTVLVILFFWVLWWKPTSLYAPSDYSNEDNFLDAIGVTIKLKETIDSLKTGLESLEAQVESQERAVAIDNELDKKIDSFKEKLDTSWAEVDKFQKDLEGVKTRSYIKFGLTDELKNEIKAAAKKENESIGQLIVEEFEKRKKGDGHV